MDIKEVIFVGLPGVTHHYGGLSPDNVASGINRGKNSSPRQAVLQVIELAEYLYSLGIIVAVLPPHIRPYLPLLSENGFNIETAPLALLEEASSSSFMWTANAATVTTVTDSGDNNLHITVANLHTNLHRRIEADITYNVFRQIFSLVPLSFIHQPLKAEDGFFDEGAANHMRLAKSHEVKGLNIFVHGGRQSLKASQKITELHGISKENMVFLQQNPKIIRAGVFHNDVIAVNNENFLLVHEEAYLAGLSDIIKITNCYAKVTAGDKLRAIIIRNDDISVEEAVHSYFFNSQIVTKQNGKMVIIAPTEVQELYNGRPLKLLERIQAENYDVIDEIKLLDLRQSMRNGGGPACLRLRIPMTELQISALRQSTGILVDAPLLSKLKEFAYKFYPENLTPDELRNHDLYTKSQNLAFEFEATTKIKSY